MEGNIERGKQVISREVKRKEKRREERIEENLERGYRFAVNHRYDMAVKSILLAHCSLTAWDSTHWFLEDAIELSAVVEEPDRFDTRERSQESPPGCENWINRGAYEIVARRARDVQRELSNKHGLSVKQSTDFERFWLWCREAGIDVGQRVVGKMGVTTNGLQERLEAALSYLEAWAVGSGVLERQRETYRIGEDFDQSPFWELWEKRREQNRIISILVVARDGQTGVGKSTLGVALAKKMDDDWSAEKATNRVGEYRRLIHSEPTGSVLLADEFAQMFDARRSMSAKNVESSQDWQMIRKLQVSTIGTCPSMAEVDTRFLKMMDLQVLVTRRGHARVYRMKIDDEDGSLYREHLCNIEWDDLSDDEDYGAVEEMKEEKLRQRLTGSDVEGDEEDEEIAPETEREIRNQIIRQLSERGMTQTEIGEYFELSQPAVSKILRGGDN